MVHACICMFYPCHQPFNIQQLRRRLQGGDWDPFLVEQNTKKSFEPTWVQQLNKSWCKCFLELVKWIAREAAYLRSLGGESTRKLSKGFLKYGWEDSISQ